MHVRQAVVAALVLSACSGGGGTPKPPVTTTTSTSLPPPVAVDQTLNTGGFLVHIAGAQETRGLIKLTTSVTNTLAVPHEFNPTFTYTAEGGTYDGAALKTPTIAAGATVPVELDIAIDPSVTMDGTVTFGNTTKNQAYVDLRTGRAETLGDVAVPPPAALTAGEQLFTFTAAVLSAYRYDGTELDKGTRELVLTVDVTNHDARYSYAVDASAFRFVQGSETLNSGVVKVLSVNPGGTATGGRVFADEAGSVTITLTAIGADAAQTNVSRSTTLTLP